MNVADVLDLYRTRGMHRYSHCSVSHLQHAWQAGRLAAKAGAPWHLQVAAWLHDVGHLLERPARSHAGSDVSHVSLVAQAAHGERGEQVESGDVDDHAHKGAQLLAELFGPAVSEPVALHVQARRFLASTRASYRKTLDAAALRCLTRQGGLMDSDEVDHFMHLPFAEESIRLRSWDDAARLEGWMPASTESALDGLGLLLRSCDVAARSLATPAEPVN